MSIEASIVVPTYRRKALLRRCLEVLAAQEFAPDRYEILVADDAGEDETRLLVDELNSSYRDGPEIRYILVGPPHGPAAARNAGWRKARGWAIAFADDDCIPHASWLRHGVEALTCAAAAAGRVDVPLPPNPTDYEKDCAGLSRGEFVTANCFCRRSSLEAVGGFDERFQTAWREDSDLQFTLLEQGFSIASVPEAVVVHPVRPAQWGVSLRQQRKTVFNSLLYKKHPALYRQRISGMPPRYYAVGAALIGVMLGCATNWIPLAIGSLAAWGFLTAQFCGDRLRGTSRSPQHVAEMIFTSALIPPLSLFWHARGCIRHRVVF